MIKIAVIGDGGWGTALSIELYKKGNSVSLWGAFAGYVKKTVASRENVKFLKGVKIPEGVTITAQLAEALAGAAFAIIAVPSQYLRDVVNRIKKAQSGRPVYISAVKGIENGSLMRMSEVIADVLGKNAGIAAISGPSIAIEVARGLATTLVASSDNAKIASDTQKLLTSERLRVYTSADLMGVELGGALKNIVAIAAGISDSLGLGTNAKAAILTRGLAEITRLGVAMGARGETFAGLSGIGDMVTTCISRYSRNRWFGEMLGSGKKADDILKETEMAVEGVATARSAYELSRKYKVSMPITEEIYQVIYGNKSPKDVVKELMLRSPKPEHY